MKGSSFSRLSLTLLAAGIAWSLATPAGAQSWPSKENDEGQVMVTVTPVDLSSAADAWRFDVKLNTHVAPITQDLATVATLGDDVSQNEKPSAWQGDPPGGHHRKGVLVFKPISPMPRTITLKISGVGGVAERSFTWSTAAQ